MKIRMKKRIVIVGIIVLLMIFLSIMLFSERTFHLKGIWRTSQENIRAEAVVKMQWLRLVMLYKTHMDVSIVDENGETLIIFEDISDEALDAFDFGRLNGNDCGEYFLAESYYDADANKILATSIYFDEKLTQLHLVNDIGEFISEGYTIEESDMQN